MPQGSLDDDRMSERTLEERVRDLETQVASLQTNYLSLRQANVAHMQIFDAFILTPFWKRVLFALDGWSWWQLQRDPQWRPWRRWWRS